MSYPQYYYNPSQNLPLKYQTTGPSALAMSGVGLVVGATAAAAANIRKIQADQIDKNQAARNVMREAAGAAVATGLATAAANTLRLGGLGATVGILAAGTTVKYFYDGLFEPAPEKAEADAEETTTAAKPAATPSSRTRTTTKK